MKAIALYDRGIRLYADSSMLREHQPFFVPEHCESWSVRVCPAVRIDRLGMHISRRFARRYYNEAGLVGQIVPREYAGCPFDMPTEFYAMDSSLAMGRFVKLQDDGDEMILSGESGARVAFSPASLGVDDAISRLSDFMTFKTGDLIVFADKAIVSDITIGRTVTATLDDVESFVLRAK